MTFRTSKTDTDAYELASKTTAAQRANLSDWQRSQIGDRDMEIGESWFLWGFYSAMTDSTEDRRRLLLEHLSARQGDREEAEQRVGEIAKIATEENRLFDAIAGAGRQAYREGGDGHLAKIATIFLNVIRNH
jgi:hypothetical protein